MRFIAVFLLFLAHASQAAPPEDRIAARFPEPFTNYEKTCGYPIVFKDTFHVSLARIDPQLGPIITLDPLLSSASETSRRRFLIAHECAHHQLGHTSTEGLQYRVWAKGVMKQELEADCRAAEILVQAGLPEDARAMSDHFYQRGAEFPGSGYPSGLQRSTMIHRCARKAERRYMKQSTMD